PDPTFETFEREAENVQPGTPASVQVRLVGSHPLWGHMLWNAAKLFSHYLDAHKALVQGKNVLELGAGAALPSIVATLNGARRVVITDYPDIDLMNNIRFNVDRTLPGYTTAPGGSGQARVEGFLWGADSTPLLNLLADEPSSSSSTSSSSLDTITTITAAKAGNRKFDLIILCDLIFNHSQHTQLLRTCRECLDTSDPAHPGEIYVFFTHHRPHLAHRDLAFFTKAQEEFGFESEEFMTRMMIPMFEKDQGPASVRATVHCYRMTLPTSAPEGTESDTKA
ncbi:hypothetical protein BJ085DRAFT_22297, partial [Dimargaris cristalligena]